MLHQRFSLIVTTSVTRGIIYIAMFGVCLAHHFIKDVV